MEITAVMVVRAGSVRIKNKSMLKLVNDTLISNKIKQLQQCKNIDRITYDKAIDKFLSFNGNDFDSLLSVIEFQEYLWDENKYQLNYNLHSCRYIPGIELSKYYMQDSRIFIQLYLQMKKKLFFRNKPYLFVILNDGVLDINNVMDYLIAISLYNQPNILYSNYIYNYYNAKITTYIAIQNCSVGFLHRII